ncbi:MAG: glycosyl hydrolase [Myxococcota bacterium]
MRPLLVVVLLSPAVCPALVSCGDGADPGPPFPAADFRDPPTAARPWTRWWWPGGDVEDDVLRERLAVLADAGFGGVEIQALDAALDPEAPEDALSRRLSYGTEDFRAHLDVALAAAREEGLAVDLTLGSGWPTGGPHVPPADSMQTLLRAERFVEGPTTVDLDLAEPDRPVFYTLAEVAGGAGEPLARWLPEHAEPVAVQAWRVEDGARDPDPFVLTDQVALVPASRVDLADALGPDGALTWDVPEGAWVVVAFFRAPTGQLPSLAARPEPGLVMDHLDAAEVERNLEHHLGDGAGLAAHYGKPLTGLFVDSFELTVERLWTGDLPAVFEARRGYDVVPRLPAALLPGGDNHLFDGAGVTRAAPFRVTDADARIRRDLRRTVSELFVERFVERARAWAEARDMTARMQIYGLDVDLIRAAGAAGIPEAEQLWAGGTDLFLKLVSSGAHLYGRPVVSAEAFVWAFRDHTTTPLRARVAADKLFAAGVNRLVYHGVPYPLADGYGLTGWHPFSSPFSGLGTYSSQLGAEGPFREDLPPLNRYVARCQVALRAGEPDADLLVLYPWLGFPASFARLEERAEPLFGGRLDEADDLDTANPLFGLLDQAFGEVDVGERGRWLLDVAPRLRDLEAAGWAWEWADPESLLAAEADDGGVTIRGRRHRAILLPGVPHLRPDVAEHLAAIAADGAPVVVEGEAPRQQPGFRDHASGDARVAAAMDALPDRRMEDLAPRVRLGPGAPDVRHVRRRLGRRGLVVFLHQPRREAVDTTLAVEGGCEPATWLDAWTGTARPATRTGDGRVHLRMDGLTSSLLLCGRDPESLATTPTPPDEVVRRIPLPDWTLEATGGGIPDGAVTLDLEAPTDWRDLEPLRHAAGPGVYTRTVDGPARSDGQRILLALGEVAGVAEVLVDGDPVARRAVAPFRVDLTDALTPGPHAVTVRVTPPLRNRLVGLGQAGVAGHEHFADREDALVAAGLLGPVALEIRR